MSVSKNASSTASPSSYQPPLLGGVNNMNGNGGSGRGVVVPSSSSARATTTNNGSSSSSSSSCNRIVSMHHLRQLHQHHENKLPSRKTSFVIATVCVLFCLLTLWGEEQSLTAVAATTTTTRKETTAVMVQQQAVDRRRHVEATDEPTAAANASAGHDSAKVHSRTTTAPWKILNLEANQRPRQFSMDVLTSLHTSHGIKPVGGWTLIPKLLRTTLCDITNIPEKQCNWKENAQQARLWKCTSATTDRGNSWYAAISSAGAFFGIVDDFKRGGVGDSVGLEFTETIEFNQYTTFDVLVPVRGNPDRLLKLRDSLSAAIFSARGGHKQQYLQRTKFRMIISKHLEDDELEDGNWLHRFRRINKNVLEILFVDVPAIDFARAQAANVLLDKAACRGSNCIVCLMDVDMDVKMEFLLNTMTFVNAGTTAYFPIFYSEFNPETYKLVLQAKEQDESIAALVNQQGEDHQGMYRVYSFGMWALAGSDAARFRFNDQFKGWGGEDNDFYNTIIKNLNVVRLREAGLIHKWHAKFCEKGGLIQDEAMLKPCINSMLRAEGMAFGYYLRMQKRRDAKYNIEPKSSHNNILIVVTTCRKNFEARVGAITSTWGGNSNLPRDVKVWYVVGGGPENMLDYAKKLDMEDPQNDIKVLKGVVDDEYPPVRRHAAMVQYVAGAAGHDRFQWILKVDDDTYVNIPGLKRFVADLKKPEQYQIWGRHGYGRPGPDAEGIEQSGFPGPFCMGGPGYVMNMATWRETAAGMDECVSEAAASQYKDALWHSDVLIGVCVHRQTNQVCGGSHRLTAKAFVHIFNETKPIVKVESNLKQIVTVHPKKDASGMQALHERFQIIDENRRI